MAAHRYWRVYARRTNTAGSGIDFGADEMSFRSAADADLSVGGTAISSPSINASFPASQAFDKTLTTNGYSSAAGLPAWLGYDHVTPVDVASVLLTLFSQPTAPSPNGAMLQWSDDGVTWVNEGTHLLADIDNPGVGATVRYTPYYGGTVGNRSNARAVSRQAAPTLQQPPRGFISHRRSAFQDLVDGGKFKAVVYTDVNALPTDQPVSPRYVRLHDFDGQGRLVRAGWSKMVGGQAVCVFENIRQGNYYAVGFDHTGAYDAEVAANLPLEPM